MVYGWDITPGVRERAVEVRYLNHHGHALSVEDLLAHICVHFCFHLIMGALSLVQLTDLLVITNRTEVNWSDFLNRANYTKSAPFALASLTLARKLIGAPIPEHVITALAQSTPASLRGRIDSLDLDYIMRRSQQKPLTTSAQRIRRGIHDRAEDARWTVNWRERWQVWQTALHAGIAGSKRTTAYPFALILMMPMPQPSEPAFPLTTCSPSWQRTALPTFRFQN